MATALFRLDTLNKGLAPLNATTMQEAGLTEPGDLEAWLATAPKGLFGRNVLWLARQDWAASDGRSDLLGVDEDGDLLISELKRGEIRPDAIAQALAYAAEYASLGVQQLANLFAAHSAKTGARGLVAKATSTADAESQLADHAANASGINESQVLVLVGEQFSAAALATCDYLNSASGEARFSVECWRYTVFVDEEHHHLLLEQVVPAPSVRQEVERKREASKAGRRARDPARVAFMHALMAALRARETSGISATRQTGQSYLCSLQMDAWPPHVEAWFSYYPHQRIPTLSWRTGELSSDKRPDDDLDLALAQQADDGEEYDEIRFTQFEGADNLSIDALSERIVAILRALILNPRAALPSEASGSARSVSDPHDPADAQAPIVPPVS